ncbi:AAA family ATPase [Microbacterium koreense]|uniref:Nuclease SbcCD subunit C n=1 Tax=Microbacterium koreense TaxID=323761 RepID=A0ABW2ZQ76_9MICO
MKLHRLELTGFGPFRETQTVDFDAFDGDGVFLISGRTGAGKSSILDGVSFALYGSVPRYEGGERRLRSDHCHLGDPTEVVLEFSAGGGRWRVARAPEYERPAKRGGGVTLEPTRAVLEERVGDEWIGRAAKPREVGIFLDEVVGLSAQQFQQVILLAQNKFSRFLLAKNDERQALLRTLFGTKRFEQYKLDLEERRREVQKRFDTAGEHARTVLEFAENLADEHGLSSDAERADDPAVRQEALADAQRRADYRVEQAATERAGAEAASEVATTAHGELVARAKRHTDLARARTDLDLIEGEQERIDIERQRLHRARVAENLRAPIDAWQRAQTAHDSASQHVETATEVWSAGGGGLSEDLDAVVAQTTGDLAVLATATRAEHDLEAATTSHAEVTRDLERISTALVEIRARRQALPDERATLTDQIAIVAEKAATAPDAREARDSAEARLQAAREAAALAERLAAAEADYAARNSASAEATVAVTNLLQRRLAGYAGELSAGLVDGEPCAVCGSTEHPHPATPDDDPVTDEMLAEAERARDEAAERARDAADTAHVIRDEHAAALSRAGGQSPDDLETALVSLKERARTAEAAIAEHDRLQTRLVAVDEREVVTARELAELTEAHTQTRERLAALGARIDDLHATVTDARAEFTTVAERVAVTTERLERARSLREARNRLDVARQALEAARIDLDARLESSGFDDAISATAALLDPAEITRIDSLVVEHSAALTAARARLLDLELETADEAAPTPDEVAAAEQAVRTADQTRTAAIAAERDAQNTARGLADLRSRAVDAFASVADTAEEAAVVTRLADTVAGRAPNTMKMDLETFVLAAELEEIVAAANLRLSEMSSGRYTLLHTDARQARNAASGLGIEIFDAYTGQARSPHSLSGGETFLASLALALGLAHVVTSRAGGIRLDTLFIDEGFGSLDADTLESALETLDELREGGRTVGVISHVESMKDRIRAQLIVESAHEGASVIRQDEDVLVDG